MSPSIDFTDERKRIQDSLFPSYEVPLKQVKRWVRGQGAEGTQAAVNTLRDLRARYPFAIKIGDELVLALLEAGEVDSARGELKILEKAFKEQFNEEIICRLGRIHRDIGNNFAFPEGVESADFRQAMNQYETAWDHYYRAFGIRAGHYPGINCAWVNLLQAYVATNEKQRDELVQKARATAEELLKHRKKWPSDVPDDAIWHAGTEGDVYLILGKLDEASGCYQQALKLADQPFYKGSIGKMVKKALPALRDCCKLPADKLAMVVKLFD